MTMGRPAAREGDRVTATDTHIVLVPGPSGPIPTPTPLPFDGPLDAALSGTVFIDDRGAAVEGSQAHNAPPHVAPAGPFQTPPSNLATAQSGSKTVLIDGKGALRHDDLATTCNDPVDAPIGRVLVAGGTVLVGD